MLKRERILQNFWQKCLILLIPFCSRCFCSTHISHALIRNVYSFGITRHTKI